MFKVILSNFGNTSRFFFGAKRSPIHLRWYQLRQILHATQSSEYRSVWHTQNSRPVSTFRLSVDDSSVSLSVVTFVSRLITEEENLKLKQMSYCKFDIDKNVIRVGFEKKRFMTCRFQILVEQCTVLEIQFPV
jgi:hypothetical protein